MNDITLHFLACFLITVIVFMVEFRKRENKCLLGRWYSRGAMINYHRKNIIDSIDRGIFWSFIIGVVKEITDIFRSDPQWHDLIADLGGAVFAGIIIFLIGMKWVDWRFRSE